MHQYNDTIIYHYFLLELLIKVWGTENSVKWIKIADFKEAIIKYSKFLEACNITQQCIIFIPINCNMKLTRYSCY